MLSLRSDFQQMLNNDRFTDFEIETADGVKLKAHKAILASRSKVFEAMLTSNMREANKNHVKILDFDSKVVKEALRFCYTGKVENLDEIARELIYAAEKYQIEGLKIDCIKNIFSTLAADNVVESIVISDQLNIHELFDACVNFIAE